MASDAEHLFLSLGPLYVFLGEVSVQVLCPFFHWVVCFPGVELCEFFIYFGDQVLVWGILGKYIFPYSWFSLYFNAVFFSHADAFSFDEVPFVYSFLYGPCFRGHVWGCCCVECLRFSHLCSPLGLSWCLIFKSFIHLEFIFVYVVSWWLSFIFLNVAVQIPQTICWRGYFWSILWSSSFVKY